MASLKELPRWLKAFPFFTVLMVYVFFASGFVITVLCLLVQPLWLLSKTLYRKIVTKLVFMLIGEMVWVCIDWADVQVTLFGEEGVFDNEFNKQDCLITLSHRGDFDWLVGLVFCYYKNFLHTMRTLPKKSVMFVPGFGQLLWAMECPFLNRSWQRDETNIRKGLKAFADYPYPVQVCIFCEGTRFTDEKFKESVEYAKRNGIQPLRHHLLPRTKGYAILADSLRNDAHIKVTYDVGFAYPAGQEYLNGKQFTLRDIMAGNTVKVFFYMRMIPVSELPESMDDLQNFCHQLYVHKDDAYQYFVENGTYPHPSRPMTLSRRSIWTLRLIVIWWLLVTFVCPSLWLLKLVSVNIALVGLVLVVTFLVFSIFTVGLLMYARPSQKKKRN